MFCFCKLSECLKQLGITDAFDADKADFRFITDDHKGLYVSQVIHQSVVEVNEEGTEAAAATAVVMMKRMAVFFFTATRGVQVQSTLHFCDPRGPEQRNFVHGKIHETMNRHNFSLIIILHFL